MSGGGRVAAGSLLVFSALALFGPSLFGLFFDPDGVDAASRYAGPSAGHWLGTDALGRDVFIRLLVGARSSLLVAGLAAAFATGFGAVVGLAAGYHGGRLDSLFLRLTDVVKTVPKLPLFILLAAVDVRLLGLSPGPEVEALKLVLLMTLVSWIFVARLARSAALELRSRTFIRAAEVFGIPKSRIVLRHLLPHALGPIAVAGALLFGDLVLYESVLSYLGLGFQPPTPSLGSLMRNGLSELDRAPLLTVLPGLLTLWVVASVHFLVDRHAARESAGKSGWGVGEGAGSG